MGLLQESKFESHASGILWSISLNKDLVKNQDVPLRAAEDMGNNKKILEYWMKWNTNSSMIFFF